jgi:hypothetical protein
MKKQMRKLGYYTTIAVATLGAPVISEISGCSDSLARDAVQQNESIRSRYPEEMRPYYKDVAYDSARYLTDVLAAGIGLFVGAGIAGNLCKKTNR